jgi:hypothetical protein
MGLTNAIVKSELGPDQNGGAGKIGKSRTATRLTSSTCQVTVFRSRNNNWRSPYALKVSPGSPKRLAKVEHTVRVFAERAENRDDEAQPYLGRPFGHAEKDGLICRRSSSIQMTRSKYSVLNARSASCPVTFLPCQATQGVIGN